MSARLSSPGRLTTLILTCDSVGRQSGIRYSKQLMTGPTTIPTTIYLKSNVRYIVVGIVVGPVINCLLYLIPDWRPTESHVNINVVSRPGLESRADMLFRALGAD